VTQFRIPKEKFLELKDKGEDYPEQLKKIRKPGSKGPHLPPPGKRLTRYGYAQYRGPAYVHLHEGRDLYNLFPGDRLSLATQASAVTSSLKDDAAPWRFIANKDRVGWAAKAKFPEMGGAFPGPKNFFAIDKPGKRKKDNDEEFEFFSTHHRPYKWTAHHLIPVEAMKPDGPFSPDTLTFIQESFYEIDNGHNLMMLPGSIQSSCAYHCLLPHVGNHKEYRIWTASELRAVDTRLQKEQAKIKREVKGKRKQHDKIVEHLVGELYRSENQYWEKIKELGLKNVVSLLSDGHTLTGETLVKEKKGRKMRWGVLA